MRIELSFQPQLVTFTAEEKAAWYAGDCSDCRDEYLRGSDGAAGFGEYLVGRHWEARGYEWIHHDWDLFGSNKPGKYPESEAILAHALGSDALSQLKGLHKAILPFREPGHHAIEQPDLLIYRPGTSELRFAECKRHDTRDKLNPRQAIGLYVIAAVLHLPVDVFVVAEHGRLSEPLPPIRFTYDESGVTVSA